jgi:hypothetical protein
LVLKRGWWRHEIAMRSILPFTGVRIDSRRACGYLDWDEVLRLARLPQYSNVRECKALVREVANELKIRSPFDPD